MTITSSGYNGSVTEVTWAGLSNLVGTDYAVAGDSDWRVSVGGTGTRPVTVAAGTAFGSGVRDVNSASINANPASIASGTRWDTVVIARNWSTNTSAVAIRTGTSTKAVTLTNTTPGVLDDQPIALILLDSSLAAVQQVVDLRTQTGKIHTVATGAGVPFLPVSVGAWAYALDTGHFWHGRIVSATPTWVDVNAPVWQSITLPSSTLASTPAPAFTKINGIVYLRGSWLPTSGTFLSGGGTGGQYSLGTLPAGYRPGATMGFTVDEGLPSTANNVRLVISSAGVITAVVQGDTTAIGSNGTSFVAEN